MAFEYSFLNHNLGRDMALSAARGLPNDASEITLRKTRPTRSASATYRRRESEAPSRLRFDPAAIAKLAPRH